MRSLFYRSALLGAAFAAQFAIAGAASAAGNLIQNGSFEVSGTGLFWGVGGVAGWQMSGTAGDGYFPVDIQYNQNGSYPNGAQGESVPIDSAPSLSPDGAGNYGVYFVSDRATNLAISQSVFLAAGSYDVGFDSYFTHNGYAQPGDANLTATIARTQVANIDLNSITPGVWTTHAGKALIATAGFYSVNFVFNTPDAPLNSKDVVIDQAYILADASGGGIPINAVPEPSTWAIMLLGFGFTGAAARLRKTKFRTV